MQIDYSKQETSQSVLQLADTHIMANQQELNQFYPYNIKYVTQGSNITFVAIQQIKYIEKDEQKQTQYGTPVILIYNNEYRLSDYTKYFSYVKLQIPQQEQNYDVESLYASQDGQTFICTLQNGQMWFYSVQCQQQMQLTGTNYQSQRISFIKINQLNDTTYEAVICRYDSRVYVATLSIADNKFSYKLDYALSFPPGHYITGFDCYSYILNENVQNIARLIGVTSCDQTNYKEPAKQQGVLSNTDIYQRYLLLFTTQYGAKIYESCASSLFTALKGILNQEQSKQQTLSNSHYDNTQLLSINYIIQTPSDTPLPLQIHSTGFFQYQSTLQQDQPTGFTFYCAIPQDKIIQSTTDTIIEEESMRQNDLSNGWNEIKQESISIQQINQLFTQKTVESQIGVVVYTAQLKPKLQTLFQEAFQSQELQTTPIFKTIEQSYRDQLFQNIIQTTHQILDEDTVKNFTPIAIIPGNFQFVLVYPEELLVVSQITGKLTEKIQLSTLQKNFFNSSDPTLLFNKHTNEEIYNQMYIKNFSTNNQKIYAYNDEKIYQVQFYEKKQLYLHFLSVKEYDQALQTCDSVQQLQEVKYLYGKDLIQKLDFEKAAVMFGDCNEDLYELISQFIMEEQPIQQKQLRQSPTSIMELKNGRNVEQLYLYRQAIIKLCESRLEQISQNNPDIVEKYKELQQQHQTEEQSVTDEQATQQSKPATKQQIEIIQQYQMVSFLTFITIVNYLSLIHQIQTEVIQSNINFQIIQSNKTNKTEDVVQNRKLHSLNPTIKQLKFHALLQDLSTTLSKFNYLPINISRHLLRLSNDTFESFAKIQQDVELLVQFYLERIQIERIQWAEEKSRKVEILEKMEQLEKQQSQNNQLAKQLKGDINKLLNQAGLTSKYFQTYNPQQDTFSSDHFNSLIHTLFDCDKKKFQKIFYDQIGTIFELDGKTALQLYEEVVNALQGQFEPIKFISSMGQQQEDVYFSTFLYNLCVKHNYQQQWLWDLLIKHLAELANKDQSVQSKLQSLLEFLPINQNFGFLETQRTLNVQNLNFELATLYLSHQMWKRAIQSACKCKTSELFKILQQIPDKNRIEFYDIVITELEKNRQLTPQEIHSYFQQYLAEIPTVFTTSMSAYSLSKQEIRRQIKIYTERSEVIKNEIETSNLGNKLIQQDLQREQMGVNGVHTAEKCSLCGKLLIQQKQKIVIFKCGHKMHIDCLKSEVKTDDEQVAIKQCPLCQIEDVEEEWINWNSGIQKNKWKL